MFLASWVSKLPFPHEVGLYTIGVFGTERKAVHALMDSLVDKNRILYYHFDCNSLSSEFLYDCLINKPNKDCDYCELMIKKFYKSKHYQGSNTKESFVSFLKTKTKTVDDLKDLCHAFGDSYYEETWRFEIERANLNEIL